MKNTTKQRTPQKELHRETGKALPRLQELKRKEDLTAFKALMKKNIPGVKRYIASVLWAAVSRHAIPGGKYKADDFVDELYLRACDQIHTVKEEKTLREWLFKKADELLNEAITEEQFDQAFIENIDRISQPEWDEMEEKFSTDGDGDFVMEEELDDISYPKNDYTLDDVFIEEEEPQLIEKLNRELTEDQIRRHINMVLNQLPIIARSVFDLAVNQQFEPREIAAIKNLSLSEVHQYLRQTRKYLRISFEKRYLKS